MRFSEVKGQKVRFLTDEVRHNNATMEILKERLAKTEGIITTADKYTVVTAPISCKSWEKTEGRLAAGEIIKEINEAVDYLLCR